MNASTRLAPNLPIVLISLWVLAGALFKLLAGTPADLPQVVRDFPLELGLTYKLVIGIELVFATLGLLRPRLGWLPLAAQLVVFLGVLATQLGDENCGCFGSNLSVSPWAMLAVDGTLLVWLLATRPWKGFRGLAVPVPAVGVLAILLFGAPFVLDREAKPPEPVLADTSKVARPEAAATEVVDAGAGVGTGTGAGAGTQRETTTPPAAKNEYAILSPGKWVGKTPTETELAGWVEGGIDSLYFTEGSWIFYRQSCDHCAKHLEQLALGDDGATFYTLIQVPDDLDQERVVHMVPQGDHVLEARLLEGYDYVLGTPGDLTLEGGVITGGRESIEVDG